MTASLAGLLGAGVGVGLVAIWAGWRRTDRQPAARRVLWPKVERANLRVALAAGAAVVVGAATGWPVGAVLAGLAGWGAPSLAGGTRARQAAVARIEAVAAWAEMLRDTMAGSAGLEQAIIATAPLAPLPIRAEVVTLAVRLEGERLAPALRAFAADVADPTCDLVVAALVLAAEHQAQRVACHVYGTTLLPQGRDRLGVPRAGRVHCSWGMGRVSTGDWSGCCGGDRDPVVVWATRRERSDRGGGRATGADRRSA